MKLKYVTITGADDSIEPQELKTLSMDFPFAEWGILVSRKNFGTHRFPSKEWIRELGKVNQSMYSQPFHLSCHLCGSYVRELLSGNKSVFKEIGDLIYPFERIQLNFHAEKIEVNKEAFLKALQSWNYKPQYIIQLDEVNDHLLSYLVANGLNAVGLHDLSHGAGILPESWPRLEPGQFRGYAGGLGPDNLTEQILKIEKAVGDHKIWIDMETKVRSNNDRLFDLKKVKECLEIAFDYTDKKKVL
jgi:hypothetical protein